MNGRRSARKQERRIQNPSTMFSIEALEGICRALALPPPREGLTMQSTWMAQFQRPGSCYPTVQGWKAFPPDCTLEFNDCVVCILCMDHILSFHVLLSFSLAFCSYHIDPWYCVSQWNILQKNWYGTSCMDMHVSINDYNYVQLYILKRLNIGKLARILSFGKWNIWEIFSHSQP